MQVKIEIAQLYYLQEMLENEYGAVKKLHKYWLEQPQSEKRLSYLRNLRMDFNNLYTLLFNVNSAISEITTGETDML